MLGSQCMQPCMQKPRVASPLRRDSRITDALQGSLGGPEVPTSQFIFLLQLAQHLVA